MLYDGLLVEIYWHQQAMMEMLSSGSWMKENQQPQHLGQMELRIRKFGGQSIWSGPLELRYTI
jgi:hypothetical protein